MAQMGLPAGLSASAPANFRFFIRGVSASPPPTIATLPHLRTESCNNRI